MPNYLNFNKKGELPNCDLLSDKLNSCEPFLCELEHPFTGEMVTREVVGLINDKCKYIEEMPNGGKMNCEYPESLRKAVAQYYKDIAMSKSEEVSIEMNLSNEEVKKTYIIDGEKVENPLQKALDTGICIISGYD